MIEASLFGNHWRTVINTLETESQVDVAYQAIVDPEFETVV